MKSDPKTTKEQPKVNPQLLKWILCAVLALTTFAVFWQVHTFQFVNYDDGDYVSSNQEVQHGFSVQAVKWAFTTGHAANWHPLTWLSHMLDFQIFGNEPGLHHITSLIFHITNSVLLLLLIYKLTGALYRSAFVSAIFALHPVHVESVAWLSERKDVLSAFFWILTTWLYAEYVQRRRSGRPRTAVFYILALISFSLGLMSKPMLVTLPCVLLLLDIWPLRRLEKADTASNRRIDVPLIAELLLEKFPFFILAASSSIITFWVQRKGGAVASVEALSWFDRIANAFVSYLRYVQKIFWPTNLAVLYPHPGHWPTWFVVAGIAFVVLISVLAVWQFKRRPYLFVGWFWFVGTLIPVIGLVQVGIQSMADRYTYIPSIGFSIAVTWILFEFVVRWSIGPKILGAVGVASVASCVWLTSIQVGYWHDSEVLFTRTVSITDKNYLAWNNLGYSMPKTNVDRAIECYVKSLEINPAYVDARNNLGHALFEKGLLNEAITNYDIAFRLQTNNVEVNNNYGNALADVGRVDEAIMHYEIALKGNPNHADAHNNYGVALAMKGKLDEATMHLKRAIELNDKDASAHSNFGNVLAMQHKLNEAIEQYNLVLQLKPNEAQVHNNLANVLSEQQQYPQAVEHYERALQLNARNPEAHYNLGLALLHENKVDEAVEHFRAALRIKPDYAQAQRQLMQLTQKQ